MIYDYCMGYSAEIDSKREDLVKQFQLLKDAVQKEVRTQSGLQRLLEELQDTCQYELPKVKSVKDVFLALDSYMDYFNFELLEHLVSHLSLSGLNVQLEEYKRYREGFLMTTEIYNFFVAYKMEVPQGFTKQLVVCGGWKVNSSLKRVDDLRTTMARQYCYSKHHILFARLTVIGPPGGLCEITFFIPKQRGHIYTTDTGKSVSSNTICCVY